MSRFLVLSAVLAWNVLSPVALGQSQGFTFQGQLKQDDVPITDEVDLQFFLFATNSAQTPVAGPIAFDGQSKPPVEVLNGLFSVELDFGVSELQQGQWLGIRVRSPHDPTNLRAYTPLLPRQHITAAPFALSVPGLASDTEGVEVAGDMHATGDVIASAFSSNSPLIFKVNPSNTECARFEDENCYLGLGTTTPQARLHIGGAAGVDGIMFPDGSIQTTAAGAGGGSGFWSPSGANIFSNNGGNVGIGAVDPTYRLDVGGRMRSRGAGGSGGGLWFTESGTPTINTAFVGRGADSQDWTGIFSNNDWRFVVQDVGNVGIGTSGPLTKLHVHSPSDSVSHRIETGAGTNAWAKVEFANGNGRWDIGTSRNFNNDVFYVDRIGTTPVDLQLSTGGNLGLGIEPQTKLHLFDPVNSVSHRIQSGAGTNGWTRVEFANGDGLWNVGTSRNFNGNQFYFHRQGSPNIAFGIQPNGDAFLQGTMNANSVNSNTMTCKVLTVTGADVAEKFPSNETDVEPGTVMEIDPENPGKLRVAREAYSHRVAGVVSGAGDLKAGAVLGNEGHSEDGPAIALSGRVWVRCDATTAVIEVGDLLTTSATAGYAMKSSDRERSHGAVLGKAMTRLARGERGLVLVLVNLQ